MKKEKSRQQRIRSAALVKMKYLLTTKTTDHGFEIIFRGVLSDLHISEEEVDLFIEKNREELSSICLEGH